MMAALQFLDVFLAAAVLEGVEVMHVGFSKKRTRSGGV